MAFPQDYDSGGFFDEVIGADGEPRPHYRHLVERLGQLGVDELDRRQRLKDSIFSTQGITFTVYGDEQGTERPFPLDLVPRIIPHEEWDHLERGLVQRVTALNLFLEDLYADGQPGLHTGVVPEHLITSAEGYLPQAVGIPAPHGARCVIAGIDVVRGSDGSYFVLEDNLRCPSGVSYVLENRSAMARVLPMVFDRYRIRPVDHYPNMLRSALESITPGPSSSPTVVLLTPGMYNSAYFEHAFLARQMGIELVEGRDLFVADEKVWMRTTRGPRRVDVVYRRIDDEFLDPEAFRADSLLGVPGLVRAARAGNVTLANAVGNGVADDKAVYAFVPQMIRHYLNEEPILRSVPTYLLEDPDVLADVLSRLDRLVVKPVASSGGYGMLIGPAASDEEIVAFSERLRAQPRGYIAQEVVSLSRHPTLVDGRFVGRHLDLRPFVVSGRSTQVLPGGLTRVALREGSLVVNSSQGGGSKDTWVLRPPGGHALAQPKEVTLGARRADVTLARVAAALYWTGRSVERAESTARLLDVAFHGSLEETPERVERVWRDLLDVLLLGGDYAESERPLEAEAVAGFLVLERSNPGSIIATVGTARENVRGVREKVSAELWEAVNDLHLDLQRRNLKAELANQPYDLLGFVRRSCQLVAGIVDDTMSHNDGWRFVTLGRTVERAIVSTRLLDVYFRRLLAPDEAVAFHQWLTVLRSAAALQEYRRSFQAAINPADAISFLLQSEEFPRSVLSCVRRAYSMVDAVSDPRLGFRTRRHTGKLLAEVEHCDVDALLHDGLQRFLSGLVVGLEHLSDVLWDEVFAPRER
jgi:uncharacterized circularly permuted ATP-grasp superfamily protein/uncharacterized alpha-E superfamily protein